jgi:hypothetical protein
MRFIGDTRVKKPESRGRSGGFFGFSKLDAACSKDGLEEDIPAR